MIKPNNKLIGKLLGRDVYLDINSGRGVHPAQEDSFVAMATDTLTKALDLLDKPAPSSDTNEPRQQIGNAMQCDDAEHLKDDTGEACYQCQIDKVMVIVRSKEAEAYHNGRYDLARSLIPVLEKELTELKGDI